MGREIARIPQEKKLRENLLGVVVRIVILKMRKHVVFVIDASRSMEKRDVLVERGVWKSRMDAVLDACFEFIEVRKTNVLSTYFQLSRQQYVDFVTFIFRERLLEYIVPLAFITHDSCAGGQTFRETSIHIRCTTADCDLTICGAIVYSNSRRRATGTLAAIV